MVPETIYNDIWNIEYKATDVVIDHFCDSISDYGFEVISIENFDTSIYISFSIPNSIVSSLDGQLIINRMSRTFEIGARLEFDKYQDDSMSYLSCMTRDFGEIENYLHLLSHDCSMYTEKVCIENKNYKWYGLRFKTPI